MMIRQWLGNCECFNLAKKLPDDKKIPLGCYTLYKYILLCPNLKNQFSRKQAQTLVFNYCKPEVGIDTCKKVECSTSI